MTDETDRERESQLSDSTKYEQLTEEVAEEQHDAAARLAEDPIVNEDPDE
jgi:hypothetical protein